MKKVIRSKQNMGLLLVIVMFIFGFSGVQAEEIGPILSSDIQISGVEDTWLPWGDIGFDGTNYLVVWKKKGGPIVGKFVDKDGNPGSNEFKISDAADAQCAIAFNGTNYLIVYQNTGSYYVACRIITPQGNVGNEIKVDDEWPSESLDVAFAPNSSTFLVVWDSTQNTVDGFDVKAKVVSNEGIPQGNKFVVGNGLQCEFYPSVASDGTDFLVVWFNRPYANGEGDIYGARVSSNGDMLDTNGIAICTGNERQKYPQISYNTTSGNYLVVWDDTRGDYPYNIYGSRVSQTGDVLDGSGGIAITENAGAGLPSIPHVGFDGTNWLVVWSGTTTRGTRVNSSGEVLDQEGFDITLDRDYSQWYTNIAFGDSNYLVVWAEQNDSAYTLHGQIVSTQIINNHSPIAYAGEDQTANEGNPVTLDGSGSSDPDNDFLTYSWSQVGGPEVTLDDTGSMQPIFTAPWVTAGGETLTFKLIVSDGELDSDPDCVDITVKNVNNPPIADAGDDQTVQENSPVILDGSESYDPDNESLTYSWVQTAGSSVTLSGDDTATPSFTAPLVGSAGETLSFELTVDDGIDSATDTVEVFVENVNHPPTADAGDSQTVNEGSLVTLDGTGSSDPDNDPLTFAWTQITGSSVTLSNSSAANPSFTAPSVGAGGETLKFQLIVNDGALDSVPDVVNITVQDINDPPACGLAQAIPDRLWPPNHKMVSVEIVGVTDPDNEQVTITVTGVTQDEPVNDTGDGDTSPDAVIQGDTVLLRAERAGDGNGRVYQVMFTADDGSGCTCDGTVTVYVPHDRKATSCVDDGQFYDSQ
jgi:hypothetical protein